MTEKDLNRIINPISRFVQINVANRSPGRTIFSSSDQIQADIARQLTRIADQGDNKIQDEIKKAVREARKNLDDALATSPDISSGLVKICQEILEAQKGAPIEPCDDKHDKALITVTMDYDLMARFKNALTAHKAAVPKQPDALVEDIQKTIRGIQDNDFTVEEIKDHLVIILATHEAAHKKAGVSGYDRFKGHKDSPDCRCYDCQLKSET